MPFIVDGTNGGTFPSWTTGTRPASPTAGQTGYNSTILGLETYNGTTWTAAGGGGGAAFPSGTVMLFAQTAAPTGWTKQTNLDNYALRVVSGTAGTGGSVAFTTAFASGLSDGATTLSTAQMPRHSHSLSNLYANSIAGCGSFLFPTCRNAGYGTYNFSTSNAGSGGSHTHTLPSFAVQYVDVIRATAN